MAGYSQNSKTNCHDVSEAAIKMQGEKNQKLKAIYWLKPMCRLVLKWLVLQLQHSSIYLYIDKGHLQLEGLV